MRIRDLLHETYGSLVVNPVRTGLTMLGIVIGIASVIAMVALGQGAQRSIASRIQSIGSNLLTVSPGAARVGGVSQGGGSAESLTKNDADAIQSTIAHILAVEPEVSSRQQVVARGTNTNTSIIGTTSAYLSVKNAEVETGVFFTDRQHAARAKVAVIGPTTAAALFGEGGNAVGEKIRIQNIDFTVLGVTKAKGGSGFGNADDMVLIPLSTAQTYITGNDRLTTMSIQVDEPSFMSAVQEEVTAFLLERHGIADPAEADFRIFNQADIVATASAITGTLTIFLGSVAGIALFVGGIGIMNMMLTSVTERTREIGLRKALGARRGDIQKQFLAEAVALTFFGGTLGIVLGWGIALGVTRFAGVATAVSPSSVVIAFGVSAAIGIVFGYYPARRAAHFHPIDALRYE